MTEELFGENTSTTNNGTSDQTPQASTLAIASLALSILAVLFGTLSIMRIRTVQSLDACLIAETNPYRVVHGLSSILPAAAFGAGILSLMRITRSRGRLKGKVLAIAGVALSVAVLVVYSVNLVHLAFGHVH